MFCPSCGEEVSNGATFCSRCGKPLGSNPQPAAQPATKSNGMGIAGFVVALCAFFLCWVPVFGWILWVLGVIFSLIGLFKRPRGLAVAGFIISFIDVIVLLLIVGGVAGSLGILALSV